MILTDSKVNFSLSLMVILATILTAGTYLRIRSFEAFQLTGFDEKYYSRYVEQIEKVGISRYPEIIALYIDEQKVAPSAFLPPTRVAFLLSAHSWKLLTKVSALESVRAISTISAIFLLFGACAFAWRLAGPRYCVALTALTAFAPSQLYISHRALIDGFFGGMAFLVLWSLWETLQNPKSKLLLACYVASLALMVLTKENAAFVYLAVIGILISNRWFALGTVSKPLVMATLIGPLIGTVGLAIFAGGTEQLFTAYLLNVKKSYDLPYAIATGDGPWFRYLSDLILISPTVTLFAIGGMFQITKTNKIAIYFAGFILFSYLIMGNLRYGMNLRYSLIWDFPLRYLALIPIFTVAKLGTSFRLQNLILVSSIALMIHFEIVNYSRIFVEHAVYDPVPRPIMQALRMFR